MSNAHPPIPVAIGEVFAGKYRVERVLGEGGMGVVLAATHVELHERVALKFLLPGPTARYGEEVVARFLREAQAAVRIKSEHVTRVIDFGRTPDGSPYIVMEYLEGSDLGAVLAESGRLPIRVAADYVLQACEAVAEAHAIGFVHRDLKPSNLFLTQRRDGSKLVKVLDFGLATALTEVAGNEARTRLTGATAMLGSPGYMSPEQIRDPRDVDVRTDVWALGVIFFELVTGHLPFRGTSAASVLAAISADRHDALGTYLDDVPSGLDAFVDGCLVKDPARRFHTVAEVSRALMGYAPPSAHISARRVTALLDASLGTTDTVPGPMSGLPPTSSGVRSNPLASLAETSAVPAAGREETVADELSTRTAASWEKDASPRRGLRLALVATGVAVVLGIAGVGAVMSREAPVARATRLGVESAPTGAPVASAPAAGVSPPSPPAAISSTPAAAGSIPAAPATASAAHASKSPLPRLVAVSAMAASAAAPTPMPKSTTESATDSRR